MDFDNTYTKLPSHFYQHVKAADFPNSELIAFNQELSDLLELKLNEANPDLIKIFSGQDKKIDSIALAYAGHQFGHFNPRLGDGRALLLGEVTNSKGQHFDIQLKGSGPTMYSRNGDGFSAIGPVIREYLVSEAMFNLGVPTTRSLCAVATNETVYREQPLPGGILTRVAASHIRIGTFEYFAGTGDKNALKQLADYTIQRHYPELVDTDKPYLKLIEACAKNWSKLIAKWMSLGFIHGVMNTDNMAVSGETIDYGPCAFMDHFKFNQVYSYIDRHGRYAYGNQINIGKWNLSRFASTLLILTEDVSEMQTFIETLYPHYDQAWLEAMSHKIGLTDPDQEKVVTFLELMEKNQLDFTNTFRDLISNPGSLEKYDGFKTWLEDWHQPDLEKMNQQSPKLIPRNHQIEKAIQLAQHGDYSYFNYLNQSFKKPFEIAPTELTLPPTPNEVVKNTFCGT